MGEAKRQPKQLTVGPAGRCLELSDESVRKLCDRGDLPYVRGPYGWRLIDAAAVERLAEKRRQKVAVR